MKDFFLFRRMVTPYIIMVIFWLAIIALIVILAISTLQLVSSGEEDDVLGLCLLWPIGLPLGILIIRIYCELLILFFRMNETLTEIKNMLATKKVE
jgi:hypothetical protein